MENKLKLAMFIIVVAFLSSCENNSSKEVKLFPVKIGEQYQDVDGNGKVVITPQFSQATVFRNGLALVKSEGDNPQWGFITEDGKYAIPATFKSATIFSDGMAWVVSEGSAPKAIDTKGDVKVALQQAQAVKIFKEGLAAFSTFDSLGLKWGFVNKKGEVKIAPQFAETGNFSNGFCAVKNDDGKWGYIDKEGKFSVNYQFDGADDYSNGKAVVLMTQKKGVIDKKGKFIINPQYSDIVIDNTMYLVEQDGKWGWCDKDGKFIINPQFRNAYPFFGNKLAAVIIDSKWGYIDKNGKIIINSQFDNALPFNGKLALVFSDRKIGFIDKDGKFVVSPQFEAVPADLIAYLTNRASNYEFLETDLLPTAEDIASKYLIAIGTQKFDIAKTLVTEESKSTIDFMAQMVAMGGEEARKAASEAKVEIKDMKCEEKGDIANCTCKVNDGKKIEETRLRLVKKEGKWLVEQKKEGGAPAYDEEAEVSADYGH